MRITSGLHKGRAIISPEGLATRPTSDRARQAVFNILAHANWRAGDVLGNALIIDIFSGTGAMGLEALSRGGDHAVFIEKDLPAIAACKKNIESFKEDKRTRILRQDALTPPPRPRDIEPRTLVFLDPPYAKNLGVPALEAFIAQGWIAKDAVIVLEMGKASRETIPDHFIVHDERSYGPALVAFMQQKE